MLTLFTSSTFTMFLMGTLCGLMIGFVLGAWPTRYVEKIDSEEI